MSEREDLIGIYGAIDRAVQRNPGLVGKVSPFLPVYTDRRAIGWFEEFEGWTRSRVGASPFPNLATAVANLTGTGTSGRMAARRILALAVMARLQSRLAEDDAEVNIEAALAVEGIAGTAGHPDSSTAIVDLLTDESVFASIEDWSRLIDTGVGGNILAADLFVQAAAPPCSAKLVEVSTPGDDFPAAELTTSFTTAAVSLEQAERFLEPSNWPNCSWFWCLMDQVATTPAGTRIYHEIVSLNCDNQNRTWTAEAYLEFKLKPMQDGARVSYRLSDLYTNSLIEIDEGSLTVVRQGNGVRVDTVKRIKFNHPFNAPSLAAVMCGLGYADAAAHLVLDCAVEHADESNAGTDFRAMTQPAEETPPEEGTPRSRRAEGRVPGGPDLDRVVGDAVDKAKQCVDDCAAAYKAAYDKMQARRYTADDLVSDMTAMWTRYLRDGAVIANLATRMATAFRGADAGTRVTDSPEPGA